MTSNTQEVEAILGYENETMKLWNLMCGLTWQIFAGAALSSELPIELQDLGLREAATTTFLGWKNA
jgi:hypothetical protein